MKWIEYCEKLGINYDDDSKFKMLQENIYTAVHLFITKYTRVEYMFFCLKTGSHYNNDTDGIRGVEEVFRQTKNITDFLTKYMAFLNTANPETKQSFYSFIQKALYDFNIPFETYIDGDNYYIFPKGAEKLDEALVSDVLDWLKDYPITHKTFTLAMEQYIDGKYIRDIADNFRKALEEFLKEFHANTKNLENNIRVTGEYLNTISDDGEIIKILVNLMNAYDKLNNKIAKHNDKVDARLLEFLMYQTGLFIRMLIVSRKS